MEVINKLKGGSRRKNSQPEQAPSKEDILNTMDSFATDKGQANKENNNNSRPLSRGSSIEAKWELVDDDIPSTPASLSHSYSLEWEKLFAKSDMMKGLKKRAMEGDLRSSRFRSVVWKLFLEVLPKNMNEWIESTRKSRNKYEELKNRLIVNPRKAVDSVDITLNNPLSQDEESPWNKFFQDNELRLTIKQDVIRTFPEVEFFRGAELGEMMLDILFCFSREHATHSYKQGMHELLAPLIFVLHCDHQAFLHACEIETVLDVMKEVMDPAYLEHDAYTMFCQVMETVEPWYLSRDIFANHSRSGSLRNLELINATPFSRSQDLNPSNAIVTKLTRIQDYVLKKFDPELHQHLERLEIAPQIYGIRWLRLLFGREFPMQDLLMLWDAIFGDGIGFDLVDYIFVAMLLYIRDVLLTNDYATCLTVLMKYPPVQDVHYFVVKALWLREPNQNPRPPNYTHQGSIRTSSSMGGSTDSISNVTNGASGGKDGGKNHADNPIGSTVSLSHVEESMFRHAPSASSLARLESSTIRSAQSSPGVHHSSVFPLTPDDASITSSPTKYNTLPGKSKGKQKKMTKVERELQEKITHLQGQINDKNSMCRYCASKLDVHIGRLQQDLSRQGREVDDEIMLSLAGLKLVRDILNGTLKFSQNIAADDEELNINDDYYGNQDGGADNYSTGITSPESDILLGATDDESKMSDRQKAKLFYMSSEETTSPDSLPPGATSANIPSTVKERNNVELSEYHSQLENAVVGHGIDNINAADRKTAIESDSNFGGGSGGGGGNKSGDNVTSNFTSKIRSLFKTDTIPEPQPKQPQTLLAQSKQPSSSSSLPASSSSATTASAPVPPSNDQNVFPANVKPQIDKLSYDMKLPQNDALERPQHGDHRRMKGNVSERELTSLDTRRRAQSNVENPASYWPDFTSDRPERRSSKGSHSGVSDEEGRWERNNGRRAEEMHSRARSKSQPTALIGNANHPLYRAGGEEDFGINPLYRFHYTQDMEH